MKSRALLIFSFVISLLVSLAINSVGMAFAEISKSDITVKGNGNSWTLKSDVEIVPLIGAILAGIALLLAIWSLKRNMDIQAYREMDSNYMEILKLGLQHPDLRDPKKITNYKKLNGDYRLKYESYAYLIWNFCESIYDRKMINKTWHPVIEEEKRLHYAWLEDSENRKKFKEEFTDFIIDNPQIPLRKGWFVK
jgi:hypothetical protein